MKTFWAGLNKILDFCGMLVVLLLFAALTFSIGYHLGFKIGLDTKVTWVGEKYTMKVTGKAAKR